MRHTSKKRAALVRVYLKKRREFLTERPWCARCGGEATEVHHMAGRRGGLLLLDESRWLPLCHDCHVYVTEHPREAMDKGWTLSRIAIPEQSEKAS